LDLVQNLEQFSQPIEV